MASWRTSYNVQPTQRVHRASLSSTYSQEADGGEHYQQKMAAPSSPVFDLDEFIYDPSSSTTLTTTGLASGAAATGGMSGQLPDVAQLGSATHAHHANGHSWTTSGGGGGGDIGGWESASNAFQATPSSAFYGVSFPTSGTHPKPSLKTTTTPQSILNNYYGGGIASFQPSATSSFSDYELGLDGSGGADLFAFPTKTDTMGDQQQQQQHSLFDQGLYTDMNKMMLLSQSEPSYAYATLNSQAQAQAHQQRRGSIRRDSTPSVPFSTATSFPLNIQAPSFSFTHPSSTVFTTSAIGHTPSSSLSSSSFLSNLSPTSPLGSPHFSERGLSISPSIPPASPLSTSAVGAMYFHQGPGTSPTPSFGGGVPPAQLSASPHQFSSAPITFVNQTSQFTKLTTSHESPKEVDTDEYLPSMDDRRQEEDGMRQRKRRRTLSNSVMGDESDEKRDEDIPSKSELRPPKQAPSMWQVYFADWLQDHKTRHPHDKLNVAQAAKEAGQLYKTLTEADKEDLKRRVQIEKQSREQRLAAWQRTLTPNDIKRENKFRAAQRKAGLSRRANIKDPNAPKKPLSAYFMFLAKIRSDPRLVEEVFGGETETTRQSVLAAQTWREMSDEEKKPFLTQAEHDKIQYEALRKIYEERAGSGLLGSSNNRKQMAAGTGYIVPQQMNTTLSDDVTASILSANPNTGNRYSSHGGSDSDDLHMVSYDPQATITVRKPSTTTASSRAIATAAASFVANGKMTSSSIPVSFSATGTVRRRAAAARKSARQVMMDDGAQSPPDSSEDDDEWVPGKSI